MIDPVAPAKAMELAAALLEERHHRLQRIQRLHAIARVIAPARMRPARVARLAAGAEGDDLGAPLWPARAFQRDVEREQDLVEGHDSASSCPGAMQRSSRCFAEPGPRFFRIASNRG